jgi:manganese/zinc/iron transport system permease protein
MTASRAASLIGGILLAFLPLAVSAEADSPRGGRSITDNTIEWPSAELIWRVATLQDYNTRVVFLGVSALSASAGLVGTFLLLRKRSLLSDAVSHATLPGLALAYLIVEAAGGNGKSLPVLLTGAAVGGVLGMATVTFIRRFSRLKDDVALALVLSVFFGLGVCFMVAIQQLPTGNAAGLDHMIYGKAAAMSSGDAKLILGAGLVVALLCIALFKEFRLLCFDEHFAAVQGWPRVLLDLMLMGLVVAVTVIGLQAVGLLLSVALLIVPAAAARFWSEGLARTAWIAAAIGLASGWMGVLGSALFPKLPAGAMIVLAACAVFGFSMLFGVRRGVWVRWREHRRVQQRVGHQHLMRACYELLESRSAPGLDDFLSGGRIAFEELLRCQSWSRHGLHRLLRVAQREGLLAEDQSTIQLTASGRAEARRVVRNHRLWELYLIEHADVAPSHVHHDADEIEHVVDANIDARLEERLSERFAGATVPLNPELAAPRGGTS